MPFWQGATWARASDILLFLSWRLSEKKKIVGVACLTCQRLEMIDWQTWWFGGTLNWRRRRRKKRRLCPTAPFPIQFVRWKKKSLLFLPWHSLPINCAGKHALLPNFGDIYCQASPPLSPSLSQIFAVIIIRPIRKPPPPPPLPPPLLLFFESYSSPPLLLPVTTKGSVESVGRSLYLWLLVLTGEGVSFFTLWGGGGGGHLFFWFMESERGVVGMDSIAHLLENTYWEGRRGGGFNNFFFLFFFWKNRP